MRRSVPALLLVVGLSASCGLRSGVETGAGVNPSKVTTSLATLPPTTGGVTVTTVKSSVPPSTKPAVPGPGVTAPGGPSTPAGPAVTTPKPTFPPTTKPPGAPTTKPTLPAPTKPGDKKALCVAAKVYAVDDLPGLGKRIVDDPDGLVAAYDAMVKNSTPELAAGIKALGPFTRAVLGAANSGEIKTPAQLQNWLINAPSADLNGWIKAQQTVAPGLHTLCGTAPPGGPPA